MGDSSGVWRRRLSRALLEELISQELRSGKGEAEARADAEKRLATARRKAERASPPDPEQWTEDVQRLMHDPEDSEDSVNREDQEDPESSAD